MQCDSEEFFSHLKCKNVCKKEILKNSFFLVRNIFLDQSYFFSEILMNAFFNKFEAVLFLFSLFVSPVEDTNIYLQRAGIIGDSSQFYQSAWFFTCLLQRACVLLG